MPENYNTWRGKSSVCDECGLGGIGKEYKQREMFENLFAINCLSCGRVLSAIPNPTIEQSSANWDKAGDAEKIRIQACEQFIEVAKVRCLQLPEQLPEVKGDNLIFVWDMRKDKRGRENTVISNGEQTIWQEPCFYEGIDRFAQVARILKRRYGDSLKDFVPTERSLMWLWGDDLYAIEKIQKIRDRLWLPEP